MLGSAHWAAEHHNRDFHFWNAISGSTCVGTDTAPARVSPVTGRRFGACAPSGVVRVGKCMARTQRSALNATSVPALPPACPWILARLGSRGRVFLGWRVVGRPINSCKQSATCRGSGASAGMTTGPGVCGSGGLRRDEFYAAKLPAARPGDPILLQLSAAQIRFE